jgi:hypothetical protein|eukprot:COSAG01_NODE_1771_length_9270_cov_5.316868_4_plen_122_part_00
MAVKLADMKVTTVLEGLVMKQSVKGGKAKGWKVHTRTRTRTRTYTERASQRHSLADHRPQAYTHSACLVHIPCPQERFLVFKSGKAVGDAVFCTDHRMKGGGLVFRMNHITLSAYFAAVHP